MPLYRLLCISAHYKDFTHIKDLVTQSATLLLENGGVVRDIESLGIRTLPQRMHRHKAWHYHGNYWAISFDASPSLMARLQARLRADPRVIRHTTRFLGARLEHVSPSPSSISSSSSGASSAKLRAVASIPGQTVQLFDRPRFDVHDNFSPGRPGVAGLARFHQSPSTSQSSPSQAADSNGAFPSDRRLFSTSFSKTFAESPRNNATQAPTPSFPTLPRTQARTEVSWLAGQRP